MEKLEEMDKEERDCGWGFTWFAEDVFEDNGISFGACKLVLKSSSLRGSVSLLLA